MPCINKQIMKSVSLPYKPKQLEWVFHRRCISPIVQGNSAHFPLRLGSWRGSHMAVIPVPERNGVQKGATLVFVLWIGVVNSGQVNGNLPGKQGGGDMLWWENWCHQPQADPYERGERDSRARGIALLPAQTSAPWRLVLALPPSPPPQPVAKKAGQKILRRHLF